MQKAHSSGEGSGISTLQGISLKRSSVYDKLALFVAPWQIIDKP